MLFQNQNLDLVCEADRPEREQVYREAEYFELNARRRRRWANAIGVLVLLGFGYTAITVSLYFAGVL